MRPLHDWPLADRRQIIGVFTDIDDTLTTDGQVPDDVVAALSALRSAGLYVIPITGRPVGWSEPFAARWPVDAIVAENGSVALISKDGLLSKLYQQDGDERAANFHRMQQVAQRVLREVPGAVLSQDSAGRETDIAIDHSEFAHLPPEGIEAVLRILRSEGMNASVSSIHINAWYGDHNKLAGAKWIVRELWGRDLWAERDRWVYVGDSTNDQLMFEAFANSIGVANIRRFEVQLDHKPRYVTPSERGQGFREVVAQLLQAPASAQDAAVTVSIVSHGQGRMVRPLLQQLDRFCAPAIAKVVLTLNVDEPAFHEDLGVRFPVELIQNASPQGFGRNHNQAFQRCQTPWFLVLNPDIVLHDDVIGQMLHQARPDAGVLAPLVQEADAEHPTPERDVITPWEVFMGRRGRREPPEQPVWFPGMFVLFRTQAYARLKGFDERFHLYCEDFDICARLRLAGWGLQRETSAQVIHMAQRDSHQRLQYLVWHVTSLLRLWLSRPFWAYWWRLRRPSGPDRALK